MKSNSISRLAYNNVINIATYLHMPTTTVYHSEDKKIIFKISTIMFLTACLFRTLVNE